MTHQQCLSMLDPTSGPRVLHAWRGRGCPGCLHVTRAVVAGGESRACSTPTSTASLARRHRLLQPRHALACLAGAAPYPAQECSTKTGTERYGVRGHGGSGVAFYPCSDSPGLGRFALLLGVSRQTRSRCGRAVGRASSSRPPAGATIAHADDARRWTLLVLRVRSGWAGPSWRCHPPASLCRHRPLRRRRAIVMSRSLLPLCTDGRRGGGVFRAGNCVHVSTRRASRDPGSFSIDMSCLEHSSIVDGPGQ